MNTGQILILIGRVSVTIASNIYFTILALLFFKSVMVDGRLSDEQRLYRKLFLNNDPAVRPVYNASTTVTIGLGITLTQILNVEEKNQVLSLNIWLDQEWYDEKIHWNPDDYGGLKRIRIPCTKLWLPDIVLYNSVESHAGYHEALAMVDYDGHIFWPPIVRMRSSCKMDITYFPFDDQVCYLKLGSWAYDGFQVDVTNRTENVDLNNYVDNGEWILINTRAVRKVRYYPCCHEPFPDVTFYLHIRRRTLYYAFNVIIPCVLLSTLSLAGFYLPPACGEKVTLGLTVLLALSVFMLLVADNVPATSEFAPLIGIYLTIVMAISAFSVVLSVFVLSIHHRGLRFQRPPKWLRKFLFTHVAKVLRVRVHATSASIDDDNRNNRTFDVINQDESVNSFISEVPPKCDISCNGLKHTIVREGQKSRNMLNATSKTHPQAPISEDDILNYFRFLLLSQERTLAQRQLMGEWQDIALVVDRIFFCFFSGFHNYIHHYSAHIQTNDEGH